MATRGDRIALRQKQCTSCQFLSSIMGKVNYAEIREYGYCTKKQQRLCDMDIWQDCKDYKPRKIGQKKRELPTG